MINFDEYTNDNRIKNNPNWPYIPDHPYRILIIWIWKNKCITKFNK